ncbi:MAG TPA: hypothetical protein VJZ71_13350 [Phycisphaerae bacterium]|nr:hypothetical protein [Phycisphaerae bacterium]
MPSEKPETSNPVKKPGWLARRHPLNVTLDGVPELDYFESEEKRQLALKQIATEAGRPTTWGYWSAILWLVLGSIFTLVLATWLLEFVSWPREFEKAARFGLVLVVTFILIRRFHRQSFPAMLRQKLIEQGVPMCLKCGYNLRGQPTDSTRCPECGTAINEVSRAILGARTPP